MISTNTKAVVYKLDDENRRILPPLKVGFVVGETISHVKIFDLSRDHCDQHVEFAEWFPLKSRRLMTVIQRARIDSTTNSVEDIAHIG